jgi:hypothetical protein
VFRIVNGSKELVVVDLVDVTGVVTDLSTSSPEYMVRRADDGSEVVPLTACTAANMRVSALIDTVSDTYDEGLHYLYVSFTLGIETPLIYAGDFHVV